MAKNKGFFGKLIDQVGQSLTNLFGGGKTKPSPEKQRAAPIPTAPPPTPKKAPAPTVKKLARVPRTGALIGGGKPRKVGRTSDTLMGGGITNRVIKAPDTLIAGDNSDYEERFVIKSGYKLVHERFEDTDRLIRRAQQATAESAVNYAKPILSHVLVEISHDPDQSKTVRWFVIIYPSDMIK